jgi:hypothetical protein
MFILAAVRTWNLSIYFYKQILDVYTTSTLPVSYIYVRFDVLTAVKMSMSFWVLTPCELLGRYQRFVETSWVRLQGWIWGEYAPTCASQDCDVTENSIFQLRVFIFAASRSRERSAWSQSECCGRQNVKARCRRLFHVQSAVRRPSDRLLVALCCVRVFSCLRARVVSTPASCVRDSWTTHSVRPLHGDIEAFMW